MSYCTDCGKKLPENAVFCPNCGHRIAKAQEKPFDDDNKVYEKTQAAGAQESNEQCAGKDNNSSEYDNRPHGNGYNANYSINPDIYMGSSTKNSKKRGSKTAVIVTCTVLALLIIAAALILSITGANSKYIGYWKSNDIDFVDGFHLPDMYGGNSHSLIALQIEKDHNIYLVSAFGNKIMTGNWEKTRNGIEAEINDDDLDFVYNKKDDTLILIINEELRIVFERAEGSIYDNEKYHEPSSIANDSNSGSEEGSATNSISGSGSVGDDSYHISVIGAEQFSDIDESSAMRIYFEFTNNSSHNASARSVLEYYAEQDGEELDETYTWNDVDVYGNADLNIRPGVKIQCCYEFKYNPKGGSVDFTLLDYNLGAEGGTVTATYTPDELPGPPVTYVSKRIGDPKWSVSLPSKGNLDEAYYVAVMDAELVYDYHDDPAIRVYYEFKNNSNHEISLNDALYSCTYQDGISLEWTYTTVCSKTDENYYNKVAPGEMIHASCVFLLRNDCSPVEAEIESLNSHDAVGQTYKIF